MNRQRTLALIPARGGSQGLPRKNVLPVRGRPMIAYTVAAARDSGVCDRTIVSTDDPEIAEVARACGAEVPFVRPAALSGPDAPSIDAVEHALSWLREHEGYRPDVVAMLQPTSPLRDATCLREAHNLFERRAADRLVSVTASTDKPQWTFWMTEGQTLDPILGTWTLPARRQAMAQAFRLNGAIYLSRTDTLLRERSFVGPDTMAFPMTRGLSVDVDDELDLAFVELLLARKESR